jgi:hypothetical protein
MAELSLDLDKPGEFTASARGAAHYKLFLVEGGKVTASTLEGDPNFASADVVATATAVDQGGSAVISLAKDGLKDKLEQLSPSVRIDSFIVAWGKTGTHKVAAGPRLVRKDLIPIGSQIAPPKKSDYVADMAAEKAWFHRLEETKSADLQPGDLLFYKLYDDSNLIAKGQSIFTGAAKGSKYSIHCQVYLGGGKVLSAEEPGLIANDVWPDCIVYRAKDPARAASAADVARFFVSKKIVYSTLHIFEEPFHDRSYGPVAKERARKVHRRELPAVAMMCSESVTYCFQDNPDDPTIPLDAMRLGPIHIEDYVNSHPERFTFAGKVLDAKGGSKSSGSEESQALNAIGAEAKADAQAAAHEVKQGAEKLARKLHLL